ncbi:MAG: alpha/beta fold hydrolase [Caldilineaceae bacterium]|nr:alpha/beta fold hydrolase [Caldilineaceae bacterium]
MPSGIRFTTRSALQAALVILLMGALIIAVAPRPLTAQRAAPSDTPAVLVAPFLLENDDQPTIMVEWLRLTAEESANGAAIEVSALRYRTAADEPDLPVIVLTDSPLNGRTLTEMGEQFLALSAIFGGQSDIIMMEPRGMGDARPRLSCSQRFGNFFTNPPTYRRIATRLGDYYAHCYQQWQDAGIDPAAYNAQEMANDVDAMRRALGYEEINLLGIGYGSHVGAALIKAAPESIARAALLLVQGPDQLTVLPADVENQLALLESRINADPVLGPQMPDFRATVAAVLDRLSAGPITVFTDDPVSGLPVQVPISRGDIQYVTAQALANSTQRSLPARYAEMAQGDYSWAARQALTYRRQAGDNLTPVMVRCASFAGPARQEAITTQAEEALLGNAINGVWAELCPRVGDPALDEAFQDPLTSDIPILLVSGSMDALAPAANAEAMLTGLENGREVVIDGASHEMLDEALPQLALLLTEFFYSEGIASAEQPVTAAFTLEPVGIEPVNALLNWEGEYFNNDEVTGPPALTRQDSMIDFSWGTEAPAPEVTADNFSVRWTIVRELPAGTYHLNVFGDGGIRVWINEVPVLDYWDMEIPTAHSVPLNLGRGPHTIQVEYRPGEGNAAVRANMVLTSRYPDWKAEYFTNPDIQGEPAVVRNEESLNYTWGQNEPIPGIPANNWSVRWSSRTAFDQMAYRFTIQAAGGVRLWLDGVLLIDSWNEQGMRTLSARSQVMEAGEHDLRIDYAKTDLAGRVQLGWQPAIPGRTPQAVFRGPTRARIGQNVLLNAGESVADQSELVDYAWEWGDGATGAGIQAEHVYKEAGIYSVTLTVTDDQGRTNATSGQIRVDEEPTAPNPLSAPDAAIDSLRLGTVGNMMNFDARQSDSTNPIITFAWDFGDDTTADAAQVTKSYSVPGVYNVILTVTDDQGLQGTDSRLILIGQAPPPVPSSEQLIPTATPVAPTPLPATPAPAQQEAPPGGEATPVGEMTPTPTFTPVTGESPQPTPTPTLPGEVPVTGNPPTAVIQATINGAPVQVIGNDERGEIVQVQANQQIVFSALMSGTGGAPLAENGYQWIASGTVYNEPEITLQFPAAGEYTIQLTVANQSGQSDTKNWTVSVP